MTTSAFEEMKAYVGFTPEDEAALRAFWPSVAPRAQAIAEHFYEVILRFPEAAAVFEDLAQVERLKQTLQRWMQELLEGPWDEAYYLRRQRIGRVHVEVGLPARYMFTSMSVVRRDLYAIAEEVAEGPTLARLNRAIDLVTELDLATMTGTYIEEREERQLAEINELIVGHMPVRVILADAEGRVVASTRRTGRQAARGTPFSHVLPDELVEAADLERHVRRVLESREELALGRVDAGSASYRVNLVPLDHPQAKLLLHIEDVTEAVEAEGQLRRTETLAQLGSLSASVAHELRNPLAGISGALQVIARSLDQDDRRRPILASVDAQIRRLNELVTDLLAFARPGSARRTTVDLEDVAQSVTSLVAADHPGVRLSVVGEGSASADRNLVHQILLNLVQNALEAVGDAGEVRLQVAPGRVEVSDTGPGVPPDIRDQVFAPFFTTRTRGTGLGLAICRRAAAAMDAELDLAEGGLLGGATFVLRLQG